ncbi:MAG: glycosyltransferase family 2 protein, partial [bacterium]
MLKNRISIHIVTKDRPLPLYGLLQSLRNQTYKKFDVVILDDCSNVPYIQFEHIAFLCNRLRVEGHGVLLKRNNIPKGVCGARNKCMEEDSFDNEFICRVDDDVLLEPDYLEKLMKVINHGYDIASGVTPHVGYPEFIRDERFVKPIINKSIVGKDLKIGDECGYQYLHEDIIPTPHFRSCALYRKNIGVKYEEGLTFTGFREELFFSLRAILKGLKIGVNTKAIAWHAQALSGGCRTSNYAQNVSFDEEKFIKWFKKINDENPKL